MNNSDMSISDISDLELRVNLSSELNAYKLAGINQTEITKSKLHLVPISSLPAGGVPQELIPADCSTHVFALIDTNSAPSTVIPVLSFGLGLFVPDTLTLSKLVKQVNLLAIQVSAMIRNYMSGSNYDTVHVVRPMTCNLETCFFEDPESHPDEMYVHVYMDAAVKPLVPVNPITELIPLPKQQEVKDDAIPLNAN